MIRGPSANAAPQATTVWVWESRCSHVNESIFKYAGFFFLQGPFVVDPLQLSKMSVAQKTYVALVWGRVSELVSSPCLPPSPRCWAICALSSEGGIRSQDFTVLKLFYLSFAARLWSTEANPPYVCRAKEDISVFEAKWIDNRVDSDFALRVRRCTLWASRWGDYSHILEMWMRDPLSITDSKNNKGSAYAFTSVGF